jgi:hypothetical protein
MRHPPLINKKYKVANFHNFAQNHLEVGGDNPDEKTLVGAAVHRPE